MYYITVLTVVLEILQMTSFPLSSLLKK